MTQDQDNIRTMFDTMIDYLDANNGTWSGTPAFADAVTRAKAAVAAVDSAVDKQQTPMTGVTGDKASARNDLEEKTLEIADQLSAFAAKNGDHTMGAQVELTKSMLDKSQDNDLEQTAERIGNLANTNMAALADYGVTAADVTALTDLRTTFGGIKTGPRTATAERSTQTASLPQLINEVRSIFRNEIDKLITKFKTSNAEFYNGYFAARVIVNRPGTQKKATPPPPPTPPTP